MLNRLFHSLVLLTLLFPGLLPAQESPHGTLKFACEDCHTPADWKTVPVPSKFRHDRTGFPLTGQHGTVQCMRCHTDLKFSSIGTNCSDCHKDLHRGELGAACERCHTPSSWLVPDMVERHNRTRFALVAAHATANCIQCHPNASKYQYVGVRTDCVGCHRSDFDGTKSPNHKAAGFSTECSTCHQVNSVGWGPKFDHSTTAFPLTGGHLGVACTRCHEGNDFKKASTQCYSCHQAQFVSAKSPGHTGLPTECTGCHSTSAWRPSSFDHAKTKFPLAGAHTTVACAQCHANGTFAGLTTTCYGCHQGQFTNAKNPPHAGFSTLCQTCHTLGAWQPASFDHGTTSFPLTGSHASVTCLSCHVNGVYKGTSTVCYACHQTDFAHAATPSHAGYPTDCVTCHTTAAWQPASFDHGKTAFPLTGSHVSASCVSCHLNGIYKGTSTSCFTCHQTDFSSAKNPSHAGYPNDCASCHTTAAWRPSSFDHSKTSFPLTGLHVGVSCASCHVNGVYKGTATTCYACHQADFTKAQVPVHTGYPTDCRMCHSAAGWRPSTFDHSKTAFPLSGQHTAVACASCHLNNVYTGTTTLCYGCHAADFTGAKNPPHTGFSTTCQTCHTASGWQPASFDHSTTPFPLTGAHITVACTQCHVNGVYKGTATTCYSCHQADFTTAKTPSHTGYPTDCTLCHSTAAWHPSTFDHSKTLFPLTGAHLATSCTDCHVNGIYKGTSTDCYACHTKDFTEAMSPPHAGFATACASCHVTSSWQPATFDHNTQTNFPLRGAHLVATCVACHASGVYKGLSTLCYTCHQPEFTGAKNPSHGGYPTECEKCHSTTVWRPAFFDHNKSSFPLTGAHAAFPCAACHKSGAFASTPTNCYACHAADQAWARYPNHAGYPTDCSSCHGTTSWHPSTFNHAKTLFPLTGAHLAVTCSECHKNNVYKGTAANCYACHQADFTSAVNPPHAGFATTCLDCHTTSAWRPATFDHGKTLFPLTGAHLAVTCADCHKNNVYKGTATDCYACHQVDFASAANPPHTGFQTTCATCHTTNAWRPATFDHSKTVFPLTGKHLTTTCISCHVNNVWAGTPTSCGASTCHLPDYNTTSPLHSTGGFGLDCQTCHTTTAWQPYTWPLSSHATWFPIASGNRHSPTVWANACATCHMTTSYKDFSCIDCHTHDKTTTDRQHSGRANYVYTSAACYDCHPRGNS